MNITPEPQNEPARLQALREHAIMDTLPEPVFDEIARRAAAVCETPIALLSIVDDRRQWFKARTGFALPELPRNMGFDAVALLQDTPLVVPDASEDSRFSCDPLVLSELNIRSYAGVQITTEEGYPIGVLSVMDYSARKFSAAQLRALGEQAQQAKLQLNLRRKLIASTASTAASAPVTVVSSAAGADSEPRAILPDVMMRFGRDFRYNYVSPFAVETIGLRPDTLLGREVGAERVPVPFADPLKEALQRAVQSRRIEEIEFLYMSPSGERLFQTRLMPEISGGEVQAILSITREVVPSERPVAEVVPVRPPLRALLGIAIAESNTIPELLQRCAQALAEYSGAPLVRIWLRDAKNSALQLKANAGDAADLISGDPGSAILDIPADADTLDALAGYAFQSEAAEAEARELVNTHALPLKTGSLLLGIIAIRDRQEQPGEVSDEMLEHSGTIASALRRSMEAEALTEQATMLAKDLLDAKLALQREAETAANLARDVQREAENAAALAQQLMQQADHSACLTEQLEREARNSASLTQELERQTENAARLTELAQRPVEDTPSQEDNNQRDVENAASLAHELRTPLNSVLGLTNLLLDTTLDPAQRELGEMTRSSARALLQLVNETFDGPKPDRGEMTLEAVPFDMRQVIEDVGAMLAAKAQGKGIDLIVRCAPDLPERVVGDGGRIRQILTNLVDNAIKFTREGFVLVDVSSDERDGDEASISVEVEDTGIGIPPEQMEAIFDRYVQVTPPNSGEGVGDEDRGGGLGLAISRELAQRMGGTIAVKSQVDDGSIFRFTLRLPLDADAPALPVAESIKGLKVLLVDGPRLQQYASRELMHTWGVRVDICATVGEMLDAMQDAMHDSDPYQVVLLDESMAGSDSRGVISAVLNTAAFQHGKLVILTSVARNRDVERMVAEGLATALTKPIRRQPLLETLTAIAVEMPPRPAATAEELLPSEEPAEAEHAAPAPTDLAPSEQPAAEATEEIADAQSVPSEEPAALRLVETDTIESLTDAEEASAQLGDLEPPAHPEAVDAVAETEAPLAEHDSATLETAPPPAESAVQIGTPAEEAMAPAVEASEVEQPILQDTAPAVEREAPAAEAEVIAAEAETPAVVDRVSVEEAAAPAIENEASAVETADPAAELENAAAPMGEVVDEPGGQQALQPEDTRDRHYALVVEDDAVNQRVAKMMLEKMGCVVDIASSGSEAVALFETRVYDLVLIDCRMPGMDGYETTAILRRMEAGERHTPIVAVTADTAPGVRERCLEAGMDAYIAKPVHEEDLKYEIEKLLDSTLPAREIPEPVPMDEILDRRALMARVAGNTDVLRSLANLCRAECARLMEEIRDAISSGDRSQFLRATHKLRGNIMSMEARAAVEAVRRLELTANQGRPADAEEMLDPLQNELERLLSAMNAILDDSDAVGTH
jgi:signal transduction histidine kinase/DNA-binding response OmpR family regulator/PAS domain-containing protein